MVASGTGDNDAYSNCHHIIEIINLLNPSEKFCIEDGRLRHRHSVFGGVLENQPIIGGGQGQQGQHGWARLPWEQGSRGLDFNSYFKLSDSTKTYEMLQGENRSCIAIDEKTLWVNGGDSHASYRNFELISTSTEFITLDQAPTRGPDLPYTIYGHAMVHLDKDTIIIIGGRNEDVSNSILQQDQCKITWIVDVKDNFNIKRGPNLNHDIGRMHPACAKMEIQGKDYIAVASGSELSWRALDTVELLDTSDLDRGWFMGML